MGPLALVRAEVTVRFVFADSEGGGLDVVLRLRGPRFSLSNMRTPGFLHFLCWALWVPDQEIR